MTKLKLTTDQALLDTATDLACRRFEERGEVLPTFMVADAEGDLAVIITPWGNEQQKQMVIEALTALMFAKGAERYAFTSEVWTVAIGAKESPDDHPRPSDHPERQERLMVLVASATGPTIMRAFKIDRSGDKPRLTETDEVGDPGLFSGRLTDMLKRRPLDQPSH